MFAYRRGWFAGRYVTALADRDGADADETRRRQEAARGGRTGRWLDGFTAGSASIDPAKLSWNVKRQALQPPSPTDSGLVRMQRTNTTLNRFDIKLDAIDNGIFIAFIAALIVLGTALTSFHIGDLLLWAFCAAWVVLGCWYLPPRVIAARLALQSSWADPRFAGLKQSARTDAKWTLIQVGVLFGGIGVLIALEHLT